MSNLTKEYGLIRAVDNVSLDIEPGEFLSLLGPSGSGKTTALMMLAGFERATSGTIHIGEKDVTSVPPFARGIGMVFQSYALFPHMSVYENIAYPLKLRRMSKSETNDRVRRAMDMVKLPADTFANRLPQQLSGGQRQRVALVRALVYEPHVLLMDEPMGALDKNLRDELKLELLSLQERLRLTIVYVTHDQGEALMLSNRAAVMRDGRIEQVADPETLYRRPQTQFVANFLGEANLIAVERSSEREFRLPDGQVVRSSPDISIATGQAYLLMLRPEEIEICSDGEAMLRGRVQNIVYLGSSVRLGVETPMGVLTVLAKPNQSRRFERNQMLGLRFATEAAVLVPQNG
ncbi:ABC transporter ATP-binding protein [Mesorhizobium sp. M4A.F.Ca.ET.050.02.1.1]|uniref:ABC transporter ATP-binding protein n=1 Tax=Mesorhizobium sp. M4A.F.Ca.ET.050.02.1.1 TaxID=2496754 RepID=UPI000FCADD35|nr:ABC transporter ATP-binding protein [Mesorhizobium sp. M4A.F.Ca.ET.050.02.1.1]RUX50402.1 ABC transporter ATP-binding protein [Mesorhizobium sp. M4A.F.Ca.ET.050.02.1.1]